MAWNQRRFIYVCIRQCYHIPHGIGSPLIGLTAIRFWMQRAMNVGLARTFDYWDSPKGFAWRSGAWMVHMIIIHNLTQPEILRGYKSLTSGGFLCEDTSRNDKHLENDIMIFNILECLSQVSHLPDATTIANQFDSIQQVSQWQEVPQKKNCTDWLINYNHDLIWLPGGMSTCEHPVPFSGKNTHKCQKVWASPDLGYQQRCRTFYKFFSTPFFRLSPKIFPWLSSVLLSMSNHQERPPKVLIVSPFRSGTPIHL